MDAPLWMGERRALFSPHTQKLKISGEGGIKERRGAKLPLFPGVEESGLLEGNVKTPAF